MGYSLNYRDVEMSASGNWDVCGPDITDHDLTIHIPQHGHTTGVEFGSVIIEVHSARSIAGNDSDFATAVEAHPGMGVFAACNWCSLVFEEDTNVLKATA